jgi:hypothetical protein
VSTFEDQLGITELIELSDLTWTIIDANGEHESLEQAWSDALPDDWAPAEGVEQLRARLGEITDALSGTGDTALLQVVSDGDTALLQVVSALIVYLAVHPEKRRVEQALIGEALREEYGAHLPHAISTWLARQPPHAAHARHHGAPAPRRHLRSRPPAPPDAA